MSSSNITATHVEPWFIPVDIISIVCAGSAVILALLYLLALLFDKTLHTVPMLLVANSCLCELVFASDMLAMAIFTLQNDRKQTRYHDSLCVFRGFLGYIATNLQNYSYFLQALYRYLTVVYPNRFFFQSATFQLILIVAMWIWAILHPLPFLLLNEIVYTVDSQICQMVLRFSFLAIYNALFVYTVPISLTIFVYIKLVRYVQEMFKHVIPANTKKRAERELRMVRRIVILVLGVVTTGFPYAVFIFMSLFTVPPRYHFRIAYIFVNVSLAFVMIALFQFTEQLKASLIRKWLRLRVHPNHERCF